MPNNLEDNILNLIELAVENTNLTLSTEDKIYFSKKLIIKGNNSEIDSLTTINLLLEIEKRILDSLKIKLEIFEIYQDVTKDNLNIEKFSKIIKKLI